MLASPVQLEDHFMALLVRNDVDVYEHRVSSLIYELAGCNAPDSFPTPI